MAEKSTGTSSLSPSSSVTSAPSLSLFVSPFLPPRYTRVSIGSRNGSMEGFVTCDAFISILSKYVGVSEGLPMDESSTPPVSACLYISLTARADQLPSLLGVLRFLMTFSAPVGHISTHLWQFTHFSSAMSHLPSSVFL